jgi:uncharacterized integral membrane protein (TIGR00698 family)
MKKHSKFEILYGFLLTVVIAVPAYFIGQLIPIVGGAASALIIGLLLSFIKRNEVLESGIKFSSRKILQYSIILIGFGLNIQAIISVGVSSLFVILASVITALITAYFVGKLLHVEDNIRTLVGIGTCICGSSAIAATAPIIDAEDKEIAYSISTILLFNLLAVFIFPVIGHLLNMSDLRFGVFAGTAINDTSSVVTAGFSYSSTAGEYATIVKLTRTLMIIPITVGLAFYRTKKGLATRDITKNSMAKIIPWFVFGFLAATIISSIGIVPKGIASFFNDVGKFGVIVAMAGIGINSKLNGFFKKWIQGAYFRSDMLERGYIGFFSHAEPIRNKLTGDESAIRVIHETVS